MRLPIAKDHSELLPSIEIAESTPETDQIAHDLDHLLLFPFFSQFRKTKNLRTTTTTTTTT